MKFNAHNQLGLNASNINTEFCITLIGQFLDSSKLQESLQKINIDNNNIFEFVNAYTPKQQEDIKDVPNARLPHNKNIFFTDTARKLSQTTYDSLSEDFNCGKLHSIPDNTLETFLLGEKFYRYWKVGNSILVLFVKRWRNVIDFDLSNDFDKYVYEDNCNQHGGSEGLKKHLEGVGGVRRYVTHTVSWVFDIDESGELLFNSKDTRNNEIIGGFVDLLLYLKFDEVNVSLVNGKSKVKFAKTEFHNESSKQIVIVNGDWNTIKVRTEGFDVTGHWRYQPCGKGRSEIKLVRVKGYRKNGYTKRGGGVKTNININL